MTKAGPAPGSSLGAVQTTGGMRFAVWAGSAETLTLCIFDPRSGAETDRIALMRGKDGVFVTEVDGLGPGARYGFRADGPWAPEVGLRFDPTKLLVDPYATSLDRPFVWDMRLALPRGEAVDTAGLVPKAVVEEMPEPLPHRIPRFAPGGLVYELGVRAFTRLHPGVPEQLRGTVAALGHPAVLSHLAALGVTAVELLPITAWIDERHLPPLGLSNAWGYNPVVWMAPDPRICPGGIGELRQAVAALHSAGIGVILDVVFNHTGESDASGATLSLRGLDALAYYRHDDAGRLINDTGCGNTVATDHPAARRLIIDAMRHFAVRAGVDGFRFDLGLTLGRTAVGFDPDAPLFQALRADPVLGDRVLIAEPWDIGPGGYALGRFKEPFLEWNDTYRDRVRRFWRGDGSLGEFATAVAGSSDLFEGPATRTVNFLAAHDGFTLADVVSYADKNNYGNGEANSDGHDDNNSWNNGTDGPSDDPVVRAARADDVRAMLATLFASRGTIMLTAGDEFGRTQAGNNNAYAHDNAVTWLDWTGRDTALESFVVELSLLRKLHLELAGPRFLTGRQEAGVPDVAWTRPDGAAMDVADWESGGAGSVAMVLAGADGRLAVLFNRTHANVRFVLTGRHGFRWRSETVAVPARSVAFVTETVVTTA